MYSEHSLLGEVSLYSWSPVFKFGFSCFITYRNNNFSLLVKSCLVKLENSCTVILPPTVSVLWCVVLHNLYGDSPLPISISSKICTLNLCTAKNDTRAYISNGINFFDARIVIFPQKNASKFSNNFDVWVFLKNGPTPASFIVYFRSFQTYMIKIFTTKICVKCQTSILWFEPITFGHESPPITTRPGMSYAAKKFYSLDDVLLNCAF